MKTNARIAAVQRGLLLAGTLFLTGAARAATPWVMGYYTGWGQSSYPPSAVDYSAMSALIHFSVIPLADGTLDSTTNVLTPANISAAVAATHAAGKKILFTVGGAGSETAFESAIGAAYQATFIKNLVGFMTANGYDGIDIDMEPMTAADQAPFVSFATSLRIRMKAANSAALLTTTALWTPATFAAAAAQFDQINIMTYSLSGPYTGWFTWHNAAVYSTGYTFPGGGVPPSIDTLVKQFVAAGVPAAKLGAGFTMDPVIWNGVSAPAQTWTTPPTTTETAYNTIATTYGIVEYNDTNPLYHWDANAQAPYLSVTGATPSQFVSYDNEVSAVSKMNYVGAKGLGGLIIWDLAAGYRSTQPAGQRDLLLQAIGTAAFGAAGSTTTGTGSGTHPTVNNGTFTDNFVSYGTNSCLSDGATLGSWSAAFAGYGCVSTGPDGSVGFVQTSPMVSTAAALTHSGLVLGPSFANPSTYSISVKTTAQLRTGSAPNPWEVGWFLWDYADGSHFYYFQAKPNGWELGKEDPAYAGSQRFLATGSSPSFPVGAAYVIKVVQASSNAVSIYVNGQLVTSFTDTQTPYASGRIGLYSEDSTVRFENASVAPTTSSAALSAPTVTSLAPATSAAGAGAFALTVAGTNFVPATVVDWNGAPLSTTYKSATQMTASVPAADVASAGTASVTAVTPGAAASAAATFTITAASSSVAAPTITAISPATIPAGSAAFNMAVDGTNFTNNSTVEWNGRACPGTVQSATRIVAYVSVADVASAGTASVTVVTPGAAASGATTFTITAVVVAVPAPTVTAISPASVPAGSTAFNLAVNGTNFTSASVVEWNGRACPGTVQGATRIVAYVSAADVASAGSAGVTVVTPGAAGSNALSFVVTPPAAAAPAAAASPAVTTKAAKHS